jgi:uncharacterized membrane protein YbhN (UPF0104 family)
VINDISLPKPLHALGRGCRKHARLIITLALVAWVGWRTDWPSVAAAFAGLRIELWLAAVGMLVLTQMLSAWRWQALARPFGFERQVKQLASYYLIGMYFNLLLPTTVGGDVVRAWYLDNGSGQRLSAFVAVFVDRFSGLVVLLGLACVGLVLSPLTLPGWIAWFVWGTACTAAAAIALAPWLARTGSRWASPLQKVQLALTALRAPRLLASSTILSIGVQTGNVLLVWLIGLSVSADVPWSYYFIMVPMVSLLTMLPVSINGIGVREYTTALFLAPLGVADGTAKTVAVLWFAVFLAVSFLGGLVYWWGQFQRPVVDNAKVSALEVEHGSVDRGTDQGRAGQHQTAA